MNFDDKPDSKNRMLPDDDTPEVNQPGRIYTEEEMREYAAQKYSKLMESNLPPDDREFLSRLGTPVKRRFRENSLYLIVMGVLSSVAAILAFAGLTSLFAGFIKSAVPMIFCSLIAAGASILLLMAFCRRDGMVEILGLKSHTIGQFFKYLAIMIVALLGVGFLLSLMTADETIMKGGDSATKMMEPYTSSQSLLLLYLILIVVVAPFVEEFIFRGTLLGYLKRSVIGTWGAILITSLLWALMHEQYNFNGIASVFVLGVVLGYARVKTDSLRLTITLHALKNATAAIVILNFPEYL